MLPIVLVIVVVTIGGLAAFIASRPAEFQVKRQGTIAATPAAVYARVNDFHEWTAWSPWEHRDPNLKRTYSGPDAGVGAAYHWVGNREVGEGRMTVLESKPSDMIRIKLEFLKPFKATNETVFTFTPQGGRTLVTWTMNGKNNFMMKAMHLVINMDKMVGGDFAKGLEGMRKVAESRVGL